MGGLFHMGRALLEGYPYRYRQHPAPCACRAVTSGINLTRQTLRRSIRRRILKISHTELIHYNLRVRINLGARLFWHD